VTSTEHHYSQQIDEGALIAGRYRLTRWLGLGAMGEVWAARDERLGRDVAIKLVMGDPQTDPETADRFTREAIAVARINHPNVVGVFDQGEYQRHQFVVMELVIGCNLDELRGGRQMPIGAALAIGVQIARALEAAHEVGVLHRDIKPANIMVSHDGVVKVLDFGIAGFLQGAGFQERLTRTGADSLGTPAYTAPERIAGGAADPRSDLYSLGCVLYVLLTGLPPFPADDSLTILHRHLHDEPTSIRRWRPEIAPEIDQLVLWLLAKEPSARPASAAVVAGRLESLATAYPNPDSATAEQTLAGLGVFGTDATGEIPVAEQPATGSWEKDRGRDRDRNRDRDRESAEHGSEDGRKRGLGKTVRKAPVAFLVISVVAGLALGVVLSRQSASGSPAVIGAMPSADAPHPAGSTAAGAKAGGTGKQTGAGAGAATSPAAGNAGGGNAGAGSTKASAPATAQIPQGATSNVSPNAPVTPYLRYTAVVAGNGCVTLAPGQFECTVGRTGGAPVFGASSLHQIGSVAQGAQPFYCQSSGAEHSHNGFKNHWWAWTESAQGTFGWVSAVDLAGGANDQPEPGLPFCGN
jgi:serine/threonine protein kinase